MTRIALGSLLALAALGCTDGGTVGRLPPKPREAAGGGAGAAGAHSHAFSGAPAVCSQPPCATLPCNPADWWCPLCASDQDCADDDREKLCSPLTTRCVECRTDDDCPASRPMCDDGDCEECKEDSDCPDDGRCWYRRCEAD